MAAPPTRTPTGLEEHPALPREVLIFLIQLSVALSKTRAYPPDHPVLAAALDVLLQQLGALLAHRPALTLGIAPQQVIVEGAASDPAHPVLRDLALRFHNHQLAGLRILQGVPMEEVQDFLRRVAEESWRQGKPLGMLAADPAGRPRWTHVQVEPLSLDQLTMGESAAATGVAARRADQIWRRLAVAAMGKEDATAGADTEAPSARDVADTIRRRVAEPGYARTIVDWILEADAASEDATLGSAVGGQVSALFHALEPETLARVAELGAADTGQRRALALAGARSLPVGAAIDLLQAASDPQHSLSHAMLRMLRKLADHAEVTASPALPGADIALRDSIRQLIHDWSAEERTGASYRHLLDLLARTSTDDTPAVTSRHGIPESARLVYMGLELGIAPTSVTRAVADLIDRADLGALLDLYDRSRGAGPTADAIHQRLTDPAVFAMLVLDESQPEHLQDGLIGRLGPDVLAPMLDALEVAESGVKRLWLLSHLERFGPDMAPSLAARLPGKPWYVQRNLLALLRTLDRTPQGFSAWDYVRHDDARVRREAFGLLFARQEEQASAVISAAHDPDEGIARLGLEAALPSCPVELVQRLPELVRTRYRDPGLRALAIRLAGLRPSPGTRDWLLSLVLGRRGWFGRRRLTPKSPEMLAALEVLRRHWARQPEAAQAVRLAMESRDPDVRHAAEAAGEEE